MFKILRHDGWILDPNVLDPMTQKVVKRLFGTEKVGRKYYRPFLDTLGTHKGTTASQLMHEYTFTPKLFWRKSSVENQVVLDFHQNDSILTP